MNKILGKPIADTIKEYVLRCVIQLKTVGITPSITVILTNDDPSAISYAKSKQKIADNLGISLNIVKLDNPNQNELNKKIAELNLNKECHGIMLEFPLGEKLDIEDSINQILPIKDVDGLTKENIGLLTMGFEEKAIIPATPQACLELAKVKTNIAGETVCVIGRGRTVGKPLVNHLINNDATVLTCHSKTKNLDKILEISKVIFIAIGKSDFLKNTDINNNHIIIDAGINITNGVLTGDVSKEAQLKSKYYSPVPGGVGVVTTAIIFRNLIKCIEQQNN